jgi:hypothetical protein
MRRRIPRPRNIAAIWNRGLRVSGRLAVTLALVLAASVGLADACRAEGLIISAPDVTPTPGSSGSFDVLLTNTNSAGGASYDVAVDSFRLALSGALSANFTDVSINTVAASYIYVTSGTTQGGGPLSSDSFPNMVFTASDSEFASPGFRTLKPGDVIGLAHVSYAVDSTTSNGLDTITFLNASLTDIAGADISVTSANGSMRVGVASIPEPSALFQGATAAFVGFGMFWWRRRKRSTIAC